MMIQPQAPSIMAMAGESLAPLELTRLLVASPALALEARGDGAPVLVLPGLGASNTSTVPLRRYLAYLGYDVQGWALGRNRGDVPQLLPQVVDQLRQFHRQSGRKVTIIGWSLGGVLAREAARENPECVQQVVTMGSPVVGGPKYTSLARLFEQRGTDLDALEAEISARESVPIRVPLTSIYSKRDGIVGWQASIDRQSANVEHYEVSATHFSLGVCPDVFRIVARKLAQVREPA